MGSVANRCLSITAIGLCLLNLPGCGDNEAHNAHGSGHPKAATPHIQSLYDSSCKTCHSIPASGAPQLGDSQTWTALLEQGREVLLDHTIVGYKRMPPMGGCIQCSEDEFAQLIEYMAGQPLHQE